MTDRIQIAPSILSVNLGHLASSLDSIKNADYVHIDVMDGHFTPNLTFGPEMVRACKGMTDLPLDVHLMITNPDETIDWYIDAGADLITVHYETASHLNRVIEHIKSRGVRAGVVLNPSTPVCMLENIIDDVDVVMLMSVNPGFSGQSFIEGTIAKRIPAMMRMFGKYGIDIRKEPILVYPTLHYQNGGVKITVDGQSMVENLFVAGEAVGGIHGRNRLMGNSLLDVIVFGRNAGKHAAAKSREVVPGKPTLAHIEAFRKTLEEAGIQTDAVSPKLLPDYARRENVLK